MGPVAVNFHVNRRCNLRCRFCFATFRDVPGQLSREDALRLIESVARSGTSKLNFAGGEPTLHPHLADFIRHARGLGMTTGIVTNGARLPRLLDETAGALDWAGLSVDTGDEETQARLGRGTGRHVRRSIQLADQCRAAGVRLKLNSVITRLNHDHDLSGLVRRVAPERWKVFQVLPIGGQNDGKVEELLITEEQFAAFASRHAHLAAEGLAPVFEDNEAMRGSYAMIDPAGRFFGNATGTHVYSQPILEVGLSDALSQVGFVPEKLIERGGVYAWDA